MKKLKGWQIALLIIFYPAGIVYLIVKIRNKKKTQASRSASRGSARTVERDFYTKVAGVSFDNANGTSRQSIIKGYAGDLCIKVALNRKRGFANRGGRGLRFVFVAYLNNKIHDPGGIKDNQ